MASALLHLLGRRGFGFIKFLAVDRAGGDALAASG